MTKSKKKLLKKKLWLLIGSIAVLCFFAAMLPRDFNHQLQGDIMIIYPQRYGAAAETFLIQGQTWLEEMQGWLSAGTNKEAPKGNNSPVRIFLGGPQLPGSVFNSTQRRTAGYYWLGNVVILDVEGENPPLSHELGHWVVDRASGGRAPRWFSEGFAQYAEFRLTGYALPVPAAEDLVMPMKEIDEGIQVPHLSGLDLMFDRHATQLCAYHMSYAAFEQMLADWDWQGIVRILELQEQGKGWDQAFQEATGMPFSFWQEKFFYSYQ